MKSKQEILQDLDAARASLDVHLRAAYDEWNPRALVVRSVEKHKLLWIVGCVAAGLAAMRMLMPWGGAKFMRDKSAGSATNRGLMAVLTAPMLSMARKAAVNHGIQFLTHLLSQKISPRAEAPPPSA